ncbi:MAG TPA: diguanylate cyclase [Nitrospirota bacterium]|nr:diguanylate cyclase [Nitrospirota bacterium]
MSQKRRIALLSRDPAVQDRLRLRLQSRGYQVVVLPEPAQVLGFIYSDPPDIMLADLSTPDPAFQQILLQLKRDSYFSLIPVIGLINESAVERMDWEQYPLDDFLTLPVNYPELFSRILLSFQRLQRVLDNNPLTKLPGNTSIHQAIERALGSSQAVCYVDINNFKPYNDTYGFSRGDEVIRMVARVMSNTVKESMDNGFVGHIGGDDFVFIVPLENAEPVCKTIIANFNVILSDLFGEEEKSRGYYLAKDRKGEVQKIPLIGISIAVVPTNNSAIQHAGKIAEVAAELKKLAKKSQESCYVIDRRKT